MKSHFAVEAFGRHFFFSFGSHQVCIFLVREQHTVAGYLAIWNCSKWFMFAWQNQPWQDSQLSRGEQLVNASAKLFQFWTFSGIQDTGQRRSRCGFFGGSAEWMSGWISFHSRHTHKVSLLCELAYVCSSCSHGKNLFHKFHMKISWFQSASWYEPSKKNILGKLTIKTDWLIDEIRKQILHLTVRASIETLVANWTRMSHHLWH